MSGSPTPGSPLHGSPDVSADPDVLLRVEGARIAYGRIEVVRDVSLDVATGQVTCIVGANGAGKSTTIKGILGLQPLSSGRVFFDGDDITNLAPSTAAGLGIALVPEGRRVFGSLTVLENLRIGGLARDQADVPAAITEVFDLFPELADRQEAQAGVMSGGQQQMIAIGRALMARPRLIILDEPSMGLAPVIVDRIYDSLTVLRDGGTTILLAEQNARLALSLSDTAYVLETGVVIEAGPAAAMRTSARVQEIYLGG